MIKKIAIVILLFITTNANTQDKNSLLWEITGNGLKKASYLYGTMHVSQKIAFHLDDVFYESLLKSDFVGLESDPSTWLEHMFNSPEELGFIRGLGFGNTSDFYNTPFKLLEPKQQEIMFYLSREDMLLNGILYRTNQSMQNFQEDTFLDMFIYQTGKKNGKKIYSLEDYNISSALVKKATTSSKAIKEKPAVWLQKKLKEDGLLSIMNNAYRDRKIHLLDSINKGMYSKDYMSNMLYIRNENMVNSIDSITKKGSLFSAVGAAHLGGEKGVIAMLRDRGYTVKPLLSKITKKADLEKKKIEDKVIAPNFREQTTEDGFFTVQVPNKMYELNLMNNTSYISPDLTNGGYVIITRINTFSKLHEKEIKNKNFDKFLFESIPGEIITKKEITKQGLKGLDILNKTKTGDYQRYHIFFTPLEVIVFKMDGRKEYVKNFGDTFFNSIRFNNLSDELIAVSPTNKGFIVKVPKYHAFINKGFQGNRTLQAVDKKGNYYFVKEVNLIDLNYIEEDVFELERIQERFYKNLELTYEKGVFNSEDKESFESNVILKKSNKNLFLKTVTNGSHYYLLGFISKDRNIKETFFNSFKIIDFEYPNTTFERKVDTSLYFSVHTNVTPVFNRFNVKKSKSYLSYNKTAVYTNTANEQISVNLDKLNDLTSFENIDSLWSKNDSYGSGLYLKKYLNTINSQLKSNSFFNVDRLKAKNKLKGIDTNGNHFYQYYLKDSLSSKAIKVKKVLVEGAVYELKTMVDTTYTESKFVTTFYDSFKPKDTVLGKSVFKNKTAKFYTALKNKDSLALDSYHVVNFKKKDVKKLITILDSYEFAENQLEIKKYLIEELSEFKTKNVTRFLDDLYSKSFNNPNNQIAIVKSILKDESKESYARFLKLMELDIPLSSNKYEMSNLIKSVEDSLSIAKNLFPEILNYATIEEYKKPIYNLLVKVVEADLLVSKDYVSYKKQILNQAKIELKRQLGKKAKSNSYVNKTAGDLLNLYVKLLFAFRKDKNVQTFFKNVEFVKNADVKSTLIMLQIAASEKYNKDIFNDLTSDITSRGILYKKLHKINKISIFPKKYTSKKEVYKAILFSSSIKQELKDSIVFIDKRRFSVSNKEYEGYFYKSKINKNSTLTYGKDWKINYIIVENKKNRISVETIVTRKNQNLETTKPVEEVIGDLIEENRLKKRKRVNLNSNRYNNYNNRSY